MTDATATHANWPEACVCIAYIACMFGGLVLMSWFENRK